MEYRELLHRCFRCGWCKLPSDFSDINCPAYLMHRFESFASGGRLWLIDAWLNGAVQTSERFLRILYSCATCKNCVETCGVPGIKEYLVDMVIAAREEAVNRGVIPPAVKDYFQNIYNWGNPYKRARAERADWAAGMDVPLYTDQPFLLYIGDEGSFDEAGARMSRSVAKLFSRLGISYGILGEREVSDGNEVRTMGERGLFDYLAEESLGVFSELGITDIITVSPHSYNSFRNYFPREGSPINARHYTQALAGEIGKGLPMKKIGRTVTYHDPCYLGRWNGEYYAPRTVLAAIPGMDFREMDRNGASSLCCGGGGGNFYSDAIGSGPDSAARARVREAAATGADTLAVSCPVCYKMLDDAVKDEGLEGKLEVRDVSELVNEALE
ncbi:MAG TPA: (Fe-S)-binding protein [Spirochaetes bacterium]|nr:(Fe-S)-binding protein [Spirochaetota bacterium]